MMRALPVCVKEPIHTGKLIKWEHLTIFFCNVLPSSEQWGLWLYLPSLTHSFFFLSPSPPRLLPPRNNTRTLTCNTWRVCRPYSGMFLFSRSISTELSSASADTWRSCRRKWQHQSRPRNAWRTLLCVTLQDNSGYIQSHNPVVLSLIDVSGKNGLFASIWNCYINILWHI